MAFNDFYSQAPLVDANNYQVSLTNTFVRADRAPPTPNRAALSVSCCAAAALSCSSMGQLQCIDCALEHRRHLVPHMLPTTPALSPTPTLACMPHAHLCRRWWAGRGSPRWGLGTARTRSMPPCMLAKSKWNLHR